MLGSHGRVLEWPQAVSFHREHTTISLRKYMVTGITTASNELNPREYYWSGNSMGWGAML